jgi:hypothetical protein
MKSILRQTWPAFRLGWVQPRKGQHWAIIVKPRFSLKLELLRETFRPMVAAIARSLASVRTKAAKPLVAGLPS